jgi:hypothetical protein
MRGVFKMRSLGDRVNFVAKRYLEVCGILEEDPKMKGRKDFSAIATTCTVLAELEAIGHVHEEEVIKHVYAAAGKTDQRSRR